MSPRIYRHLNSIFELVMACLSAHTLFSIKDQNRCVKDGSDWINCNCGS